MTISSERDREIIRKLREFNWKRMPDWFRAHFSDNQRYLIFWIIAGLLCGGAAVLFHLALHHLFSWVQFLGRQLGGGIRTYLFLALAPAFGGLVSGIIIQYISPTSVGSGIPQTKERYYRDFGHFEFKEAIWRFIVGTISVGCGMSLGREGPTVHICAVIASKVGQVFGLAKKRVQAMIPLGMGAGIAAAFNTPMAAMFFVFEELLGDFSSKSLFGILVSVVLASIVERTVLGEHPVFNLLLPDFETSTWMLICIPLGILAGLIGHLFVRSILNLRLYFKGSRLPQWLKPAFGGLGIGLVAVSILYMTGRNGVFAIGYDDLSDALNGHILSLWVLVALFVGKFIATTLAYAAGGSGGLFAPTLFLGGILGGILGVVGMMFFGFSPDIVGAISLLGMGAFFASVIRCPFTSFMIIFELTQNYTLMLPLMIGNFISYMIGAKLQPVALYDSLLLQDKISLKKMTSYRGEQDWQNLPVKTIMTFDICALFSDQPVGEALEHLDRPHHGYPVLDKEGRLVGMITHHELEDEVRDNPVVPVGKLIKHRRIISATPEQSIREVATRLVVEDVLQVPVVSDTDVGKLLGIVTLHDIARQQNAIDEAMDR